MEENNFGQMPESQPSGTPPPQAPERKSSGVMNVIIIVLLLVVIGGGAYFFMQNKSAEEPKNEAASEKAATVEEEEVSEVKTPRARLEERVNEVSKEVEEELSKVAYGLEAGFIYFQEDEGDLNHYDTEGNDTSLATVDARGSTFKAFGFYKGSVYYATMSGELGRYGIEEKEESVIKISGVEAALKENGGIGKNSLGDILVTEDGKVYYMKGVCMEGQACSLGIYDLKTNANSVLFEGNLYDETGIEINSGFHFDNYDEAKNVLVLRLMSGDGPGAGGTFYNFDLATSKISKGESATKLDCDMVSCDEEQVESNKKYDELFGAKEFSCSSYKLKQDQENLVVKGNSGDKTLEMAYFIYCVE